MSSFAVLIIDNDPAFRSLAREVLAGEGFSVAAAATGQEGLAAFAARPAQLVLLDLVLPDMPGPDVCRALRARHDGDAATVVLVSASHDLAERVAGFHAGADGFFAKPIDSYELMLRVKAASRRAQSTAPKPGSLQVGRLSLNANERTLTTPEGMFALTPVEFQLVHFLMRSAGAMVSTEALLCNVWHYPPNVGSPDVVRFHVRALRMKIEPDPAKPVYLLSAQGFGYTMQDAAAQVAESAG